MDASVCAGQLDVAVRAGVAGKRVGGDSHATPELATTAGVVADEEAAGEVDGRAPAHAHVMAIRTRARPPRMPRQGVLPPRVPWSLSEVEADA
jgi:hypothetical protein